jgi:hypothetical protein
MKHDILCALATCAALVSWFVALFRISEALR